MFGEFQAFVTQQMLLLSDNALGISRELCQKCPDRIRHEWRFRYTLYTGG